MSHPKVLIVDDHAMFREGIRLLLVKQAFGCNLMEAGSCAEAFSLMQQHDDLNLVLLDLALPDMAGIDALNLMRERFPTLPVVVLSGSEDRALVLESINRGAMGFISKSSSGADLMNALGIVFSGSVYLPPTLLGQSVTARRVPPELVAQSTRENLSDKGLSKRQIEVLELMVQGLPNKLVARELNLSEATVKTHVASALRALNVKNRTQAVFAVAKLGLADTDSALSKRE